MTYRCQYLRYAEDCGKNAEILYDRTDSYTNDTKNQNMQHFVERNCSLRRKFRITKTYRSS